jgi:hypothetical protein
MDFVIVVTGNLKQEKYWKEHLTRPNHHSVWAGARIIVVHEDWPNGAGNALGTLYAYQKAIEAARQYHKIDLLEAQADGASVAMYHTAGKGTRLAPLPGSEQNNKSAVKLPCLLPDRSPVTILEAVIRQTSLYAETSKGRLSVFWGDQIFIPSLAPAPRRSHAEILACLSSFPTRNQWEERGLSRYGLMYVAPTGETRILEKIDYDTLLGLAERGIVQREGRFGPSLGSFSLSLDLLEALLSEFSGELKTKKGRLDSDPHLWMPLTLPEKDYVQLMTTKGMAEYESRRLFQRMQKLKARLHDSEEPYNLLGASDAGQDSYWWDFGSVRSYYENCLRLTENSVEGEALRLFFGSKCTSQCGASVDPQSALQGCEIGSGTIQNSVLIGVKADSVHVKDCVIIGGSFPQLRAERCLAYNLQDDAPVDMPSGTVCADTKLTYPLPHVRMRSDIYRDAGQDWNQRLPHNPFSYAELYLYNNQQN